MLDKIFKVFFTEKKQNKKTACITVVRESSLFNQNYIIESRRQISKRNTTTCLSQYFSDLKGLNAKQRQTVN